uniref:Uncharacterized protein n=1 Tax=Alexandrium monilatum TaxID=311494 RepID=A0A7S4QRI6_9DINO|mmetsp:Transcript_42513/g.132602  ORF Transcript_42513/g.132602 Transcript_42513/m.132602 type:complete len:1144 (+) Transcript_42513:98-3529(+)
MCRGWRKGLIAALLLGSAASVETVFRDDALALVQSRRLVADARPPKFNFEAGQDLEVNVFGSKWVNCTIVRPGTKPDTYTIHVPSFPTGHQDLPDVKASTLRDPRAEEKRIARKAAEVAQMKADEEARRQAEEAERRAQEEEERRLADLRAHTFDAGEQVEVRTVGKNGTIRWVKATIEGQGDGPNKYNIDVQGAKLPNINSQALRKDSVNHFEVGARVEVKAKGGNLNWVKCVVMSRGDTPNTYNIHIPAAPKNKQDVYNVPATSLRQEVVPVWTPKYEIGEIMEVKLNLEPDASSWVRCNITDKAVQVETYNIFVFTHPNGYHMQNVSAAILRQTPEGLKINAERKARRNAEAEAKRKAEEEGRAREHAALLRAQRAQEAASRAEERQKREEEQAKTNKLMYWKVQARKLSEQAAKDRQEKIKQMEEELKRVEHNLQEIDEQKRNKDGAAFVEDSDAVAKLWTETEEQRQAEAFKNKMEATQRARREKQMAEREEARRQEVQAAQEALEKREAEEKLRMAMEKRTDLELVSALPPALEDAKRTGMELQKFLEPSRTLVSALWNTTGERLRQAVAHRDLRELQQALLESQAADREMTRLRAVIKACLAQQKGEEVPEIPDGAEVAELREEVLHMEANVTRASLSKALSRDYTAPLLKAFPEYTQAQRILRTEGTKAKAIFHMKDAANARDLADLEDAMREARAAQVSEAEITQGRVILGMINATLVEDIPQLQSAIRVAEDFLETFCGSSHVCDDTASWLAGTRNVLEEERAKEPVRLELRQAMDAQNVSRLELALQHAQEVRLPRTELSQGEKLHKKLVTEEKAEEKRQLQAAKEAKRAAKAKEKALKKQTRIAKEQAKKEALLQAKREALDKVELQAAEEMASKAAQNESNATQAEEEVRLAAQEAAMAAKQNATSKVKGWMSKMKAKMDTHLRKRKAKEEKNVSAQAEEEPDARNQSESPAAEENAPEPTQEEAQDKKQAKKKPTWMNKFMAKMDAGLHRKQQAKEKKEASEQGEGEQPAAEEDVPSPMQEEAEAKPEAQEETQGPMAEEHEPTSAQEDAELKATGEESEEQHGEADEAETQAVNLEETSAQAEANPEAKEATEGPAAEKHAPQPTQEEAELKATTEAPAVAQGEARMP